MTLLADNSPILLKTQELCAAIAGDPTFLQFQTRIEKFLDDDAARAQYKGTHEMGENLHQKQHAGLELGSEEIKAFEEARDALFENAVACEFMDAQRALETLRKQITKHIGMTLELGRVPTADDLTESSGGCCGGGGGGCGCHDGEDGHGGGGGGCCGGGGGDDDHGHDHGHGGGGCGCH